MKNKLSKKVLATICSIALSVVLLSQSVERPAIVTKTEHGWRTDRVIATRYTNPMIGRNVGFSFPKDPNNCDRAEIDDFMKEWGVSIYSSGGYPGAEMFGVFDSQDKDYINAKLQKMLPPLDQLMLQMSRGEKIKPSQKTAPKQRSKE